METTEYFGLYVTATPPAPTLTGTELVPVVIAGVTNNTTTADIAGLATSTGVSVIEHGNTPFNISVGAGGPTVAIGVPAAPLDHLCAVEVVLVIGTADATAIVTPFVQFTDPTGPQTINGVAFTMAAPNSQSMTVNIIGDGVTNISVGLTWTGAAGTGVLGVLLAVVDYGAP